ncbi:FAD:protein FMN transferase [Haloferula sp. A504]|uniref:FAD:protein FMN transferase n=1 Tax=Haloferula sp. A504 TaxID=3373601 RepID=UPI0031BD3C47|nr:FAD:protein FMN transferase [Verrucomicrobiaceae bacterium E54]
MKLFALLLIAPLTAGERQQFSRELMGTTFSITCYTDDPALAKKAAAEAFAAAAAINAVASDYLTDSELSKLSSAPVDEPIELSATLFDLLETARRTAQMTGGLYDPTLGPLTRLWRESRRTGCLPDSETLAAARKATGWQHYALDSEARTITLGKPGMRFDLGGLAKGYAADQMLAILVEQGIQRSSVVAGGDIAVAAAPSGRGAWRVGLKTFDPRKPDEAVPLVHAAVSTSGDLFQFVDIDGVRYSHILDPATGLGLTDPIAVSVIAPKATLSDPLATAACVAGADKAKELLKSWGATDFRVRTR